MPFDDGLDDDDELAYRPPLPPDDRLWRHPSELPPDAPPVVVPAPRGDDHERPARTWAIALVSGLTGALLATGLAAVAGGFDRARTVQVVERQAAPVSPVRGELAPSSVTEVAERVRPAIVQILVQTAKGNGAGSGVLFRDDGHILTNNHVTEGAQQLTVVLADGRHLDGKVVGHDTDTDIAVVKVDGEKFPTAVLGTATMLRTGDGCIAIGSPLGLAGGPSVSVGVVSALGRSVEADDEHLYDMIQTDAAISPGSSGGALLDRSGSVIGVTTAIGVSDAGAEGIGFATPIDIARSIASELIATGKATHVWLGVEGSDVDQETADQLKLVGGAVVKRVVGGSPAATAGFKSGDVIVAVDGTAVRTMAALVVALRSHKVGDRVKVSYVRGTDRRDVTVALEERTSSSG
jgi:S1-C subfamily serine protease